MSRLRNFWNDLWRENVWMLRRYAIGWIVVQIIARNVQPPVLSFALALLLGYLLCWWNRLFLWVGGEDAPSLKWRWKLNRHVLKEFDVHTQMIFEGFMWIVLISYCGTMLIDWFLGK